LAISLIFIYLLLIDTAAFDLSRSVCNWSKRGANKQRWCSAPTSSSAGGGVQPFTE